jgi:hypothetical protein
VKLPVELAAAWISLFAAATAASAHATGLCWVESACNTVTLFCSGVVAGRLVEEVGW